MYKNKGGKKKGREEDKKKEIRRKGKEGKGQEVYRINKVWSKKKKKKCGEERNIQYDFCINTFNFILKCSHVIIGIYTVYIYYC